MRGEPRPVAGAVHRRARLLVGDAPAAGTDGYASRVPGLLRQSDSRGLFGPGRLRAIADDAAAVGDAGKPVVLVVDAALRRLRVAARVVSDLEGAGAEVAVFSDVAGEPKQAQIDSATDFVRTTNAGLVICLGGGLAMDIGKVAATVAITGDRPIDFAMDGKPLPRTSIPKICVPTTAGTGSELSATNIFADRRGRKVWVWAAETKPDRVILDPELTLPPQPTAWTGLDAFAHALESCTNRRRHPANDLFAHTALGLISGALETAVNQPRNLAARSRMLLGSAYAGIAIDNCGAGMAHNISHALAALGSVPHGLATALGLEAVLGWQAATDNGPFAAAGGVQGGERGRVGRRNARRRDPLHARILGAPGKRRRHRALRRRGDSPGLNRKR